MKNDIELDKLLEEYQGLLSTEDDFQTAKEEAMFLAMSENMLENLRAEML